MVMNLVGNKQNILICIFSVLQFEPNIMMVNVDCWTYLFESYKGWDSIINTQRKQQTSL